MRYFFHIITIILLAGQWSCNKDADIHRIIGPDTDTLPDTSKNVPITPPNTNVKIKQSIKIHDDNVNGVFFRKKNKIQEAVYYFYNDEGLLDSLAVFSDTTRKLMTKSMKLQYIPTERRIKAYMYEFPNGAFSMNLYYDQSLKLTEVSMDSNGVRYGIFYLYDGHLLRQIRMEYGNTTLSTNMIYDTHFNLEEYITFYPTISPVKVQFDYDYSYPVDKTFDIKFGSIEIKFLYEGAVNTIHLMGLNMGAGNTHILKRRTETEVRDSTAVRNYYEFEYTKDLDERLIERKVIFNKNTEAYYQYRY